MARVIICCGKIASGKTTFCKKLEKEHGFFIFNADEWMIHFFGEAPDCTVFHLQLEKCIEMIYRIADNLLKRGIDVAFDFGFWTKKDRDDCFKRFKNGINDVRMVYFPIDEERQLRNLHIRQNGITDTTFLFTEEKLKFFNNKFQVPEENECICVENFVF